MTTKRRRTLLLVSLAVGLVAVVDTLAVSWFPSVGPIAAHQPEPEPPTLSLEKRTSSPAVAGLTVSVKSLDRTGDRLVMVYSFRWVGPAKDRTFWFRRPWGAINVYYWDAAGRRLDRTDDAGYMAPRSFTNAQEGEFVGVAGLSVPEGARELAFELGRCGLVTRSTAIPD